MEAEPINHHHLNRTELHAILDRVEQARKEIGQFILGNGPLLSPDQDTCAAAIVRLYEASYDLQRFAQHAGLAFLSPEEIADQVKTKPAPLLELDHHE